MDNLEKLQKAFLVQKKIKEIQNLTFENVESNCGRAMVTVNGNLEITDLKVIDDISVDELRQIFPEITNIAIQKINLKVKQSMALIAQDLGLPNMPL